MSGAVVQWNGTNKTTIYVSTTQLTASISAADVALAGTVNVTVFNAAPGGGLSNPQPFTANNPMPRLSSLDPSSALVGGSAFTLTVNGTNFVSGGPVSITVSNPSPGGGTSNGLVFSIVNPVPTLTSLSPSSALAGGSDFTLTVNGTNFIPGSTVKWKRTDRSTTYVSSAQLLAAISAADIAALGTASVTVVNPTPEPNESNAVTFSIVNPVATLTGLVPGSAMVYEPGFTMAVSGRNFVPGSVVRWNGADLATTFVTSEKLTVNISSAEIAMAGTANVTVFNPSPGGGLSNALPFSILNPVPSLDSLDPDQAIAGGKSFILTVTGSNFVPGSVVRWDNKDRGTVFVSSTELRATINPADIKSGEIAAVTVFNPEPGGGVSDALEFTVFNPQPVLNSLSQTSVTTGGASFVLTLDGSGFMPGAVVRWNGLDRTTTQVSEDRLRATILASDIAMGGEATITVFNPSPGGGLSNGLPFSILNPVPRLTTLSPLSAISGGSDFTLTLHGKNFVQGSVVEFNGSPRPTIFVSGIKLQVTVFSADIAASGVATITVSNEAPGGGTSNALLFRVRPPTRPGISIGTISIRKKPAM